MSGKLFAAGLAAVSLTQALPAVVCALVGMSALAVAVVGGPLTHGVPRPGKARAAYR